MPLDAAGLITRAAAVYYESAAGFTLDAGSGSESSAGEDPTNLHNQIAAFYLEQQRRQRSKAELAALARERVRLPEPQPRADRNSVYSDPRYAVAARAMFRGSVFAKCHVV